MYKLKLGGIEITCDTAEEAVELTRAAADPAPNGSAGPPRKRGDLTRARLLPRLNRARRKQVIKMLELIRSSDQKGVPSETIWRDIGIKNRQSLGPVFRALREVLGALKLAQGDVIVSMRLRKGVTWKAGPKIGEVITYLGEETGR